MRGVAFACFSSKLPQVLPRENKISIYWLVLTVYARIPRRDSMSEGSSRCRDFNWASPKGSRTSPRLLFCQLSCALLCFKNEKRTPKLCSCSTKLPAVTFKLRCKWQKTGRISLSRCFSCSCCRDRGRLYSLLQVLGSRSSQTLRQ